MSQYDVESDLHVSRQAISRWESGSIPIFLLIGVIKERGGDYDVVQKLGCITFNIDGGGNIDETIRGNTMGNYALRTWNNSDEAVTVT